MKKYIDAISPIIEKIIKLTESSQMSWEKTGDRAYRCVDVKDNLSLEISRGNGFVDANIGLKLYSENKLEFEYTPGFVVNYPGFEALLSKLYTMVEEENFNRVTNNFSKIMLAFSNEANK